MACHLSGAKPLSEPMLEYISWIFGNKFQWNLGRKLYIFVQENAFENVVWKMAAILSRPQCVKDWATDMVCDFHVLHFTWVDWVQDKIDHTAGCEEMVKCIISFLACSYQV